MLCELQQPDLMNVINEWIGTILFLLKLSEYDNQKNEKLSFSIRPS